MLLCGYMKNITDKSMNVADKLKKVLDKGKQAEIRLVKLAMKKASKKKLVKQAEVMRELGMEEKKLTKKLNKINEPETVSDKEKVTSSKSSKLPKVKAKKEERAKSKGTKSDKK